MQERQFLTKVDASTEQGRTRRSVSSVPPVLLDQSRPRLRVLSLVFAGLFAFAWLIPCVLEGRVVEELTNPADWGPAALILVTSLIVYGLSRGSRVPTRALMNIGLAYAVVVSYGLAIVQYWGAFGGVEAADVSFDRVGLTTIAVWMLLFTVVVPNRPRNLLLALTLSASAAPTVFAISASAGEAPVLSPFRFFFTLVFPYLMVVAAAYFAATIIYRLGTEVRRAQEMGSYRLEARLGQGGMGEVWSARHAMLARPAAVKLIRRDAIRGDSRTLESAEERFEREAQATAGLQSAHTVALYDFGTSQDGTLFYVMELLDGVDLNTMVARFGPLAPERVVHILRQACASLEEAHARGLVHRDIKPANIYLCHHALEYDFVKVLDFGLVKRHVEVAGDEQVSLTQAGTIAGTPGFMAPEMALGSDAVDGRADIYALGCIAYWLLTGHLVFKEDTPMGMIVAHIQNAPTPPGRLSEILVPEALEGLVLECLAKDPANRPQSAAALAGRLADLELSDLWTQERAARWWEIHRPTAERSAPQAQ